MSEPGDYTPVSWGGHHDFKSARAAYDKHVDRGYADAVAEGKTTSDVLPENLSTESDAPMSVDCDGTASMDDWPAIIFSKLPYLYHEATTEYLTVDTEISFGAFGDVPNGERYPIQARPFDKGEALKTRLTELVIEKGGGGTMHESAETLALYRARNVSMPKAVNKPIHVIITDEMPYDHVTKAQAAQVHVKIEKKLISTVEIFEELKAKYSVYVILKPYHVGASDRDSDNQAVMKAWEKLVGRDHIAGLPDPNRVMDVLLGIMAKETGRIEYFRQEIEERQRPDQVATAYKALNTIHALPSAAKGQKRLPAGGKSTMFRGKGGKKSDDLL